MSHNVSLCGPELILKQCSWWEEEKISWSGEQRETAADRWSFRRASRYTGKTTPPSGIPTLFGQSYFTSVELWSSHVGWKMSLEPPSTQRGIETQTSPISTVMFIMGNDPFKEKVSWPRLLLVHIHCLFGKGVCSSRPQSLSNIFDIQRS